MSPHRKPTRWAPRAGLILLAQLALSGGCWERQARSARSFDQIRQLVPGKTASQVMAMLGAPDAREQVTSREERWIWRRYTFLDGEQYAGAVRGQVVDLLIVLAGPEAPRVRLHAPAPRLPATLTRRVRDAFAVSYSIALPAG
jgi:hypothetical protein